MWSFFFFNDTATTEIYTLSLHDALPILTLCPADAPTVVRLHPDDLAELPPEALAELPDTVRVVGDLSVERRSEEHTSELQSRQYLVCRLLLEKKKKITQPV